MASHERIIRRWRDRIINENGYKFRNLKGGNVFAEEDVLYSWGMHFELARPLRDADTDKPTAWLLNGDRYSVSTARHQSILRRVLSSSKLPTIIVPHSAMFAAGIAPNSIVPVHVTEDRNERKKVTRSWIDGPPPGTRLVDKGDRQVLVSKASGLPAWNWTIETDDAGKIVAFERFVYTHRLGESTFTALVSDGKGGTRRASFLSGFDERENPPRYFLTELPGPAETVTEARDLLKPNSVIHAEGKGMPVERQGDVFFIRADGFTPPKDAEQVKRAPGGHDWLNGAAKETYLLDTNHTASLSVTVDGLTFVKGVIRHEPTMRTPDHKQLRLGREHWWLAALNRTPRGVAAA